jgi:hypothetical protein
MARVARRFRLLRRDRDGTTVLECNDADGYAMLFIAKDGSQRIHEVGGICGYCALGRPCPLPGHPRRDRDGSVQRPEPGTATESPTRIATSSQSVAVPTPAPSPAPTPAPVAEVSVADSDVVKPIRRLVPRVAHHAPVVEPEPADDPVTRDARAVGQSVWFRGGRHRNAIFQGQGTMHADAVLARAVERGWLSVNAEGVVAPATVNPAATMPVDTRSAKERAMAWGPGPGGDW